MKIILMLIISFLLFGCNTEKVKPKINTELEKEQLPVHESWDTKIIFSEQGITKAILYAKHLEILEDQQGTFVDGVKIDFYDKNEILISTLTSDKGRVDDKTQNMFAVGNVVVVNEENTTVETDELMWRKVDQMIMTDKYVVFTSANERIEGYGFESSQSLKNYKIFNPIIVTTYILDNENTP
ncbi:MAG: LPS export ABC transporter periplasmic protein LptC [Ignavibacteriales bacterium]|nr:LPS export ABC transporter periplasmic protein LptC [Ignavibacteriales bacterium]